MLVLVVLAGRLVRSHMLLGPESQWRQQLWLDELVQPAEAAPAEAAPSRPELTLPLPINCCSADSLTLLPGVGPVLADRIEAARREGTVFRGAPDLEAVKGIGPALSARLAAVIDFRPPDRPAAGTDSLRRMDPEPANSR